MSTISPEDAARLPPMISSDEVAERRRLEELKAFRRYLVDSGSIKSLVKLYQHIAKHEVRMDNPTVTKDFLAAFAGENPGIAEAEQLEAENFVLRERNSELSLEFDRLTREVEMQQRVTTAESELMKQVSMMSLGPNAQYAYTSPMPGLGSPYAGDYGLLPA